MVYITRYNADRIINNIDIKKFDIKEELYKARLYMISPSEVKKLIAYKSLMKGRQDVMDVFKKIKKNKDTHSFVKETDHPSYHMDKDCSRLNSNYENYRIPKEIEYQGKDAVKEFRKWYRDRKELLEFDPEMFYEQLQDSYGIKELEKVEYDNSGVKEFENCTVEELEKQIDILKRECDKFYHNPNNKPILSKFLYRLDLADPYKEIPSNKIGKTDKEIKAVLAKFRDEYKKPLVKLLKLYYCAKYNPNLEYDKNILEQLGFKPCTECCG